MVNPTAWNWRGYTGFFWGGAAAGVFIWAYFRLPETKDRTFHELDILFAKGVPARMFASTNIDEFDEHEQNQLAERYSIAGPRRGFSVTNFLADHGRSEEAAAQRRASLVTSGEHRRPSIGPAVTEYLEKH